MTYCLGYVICVTFRIPTAKDTCTDKENMHDRLAPHLPDRVGYLVKGVGGHVESQT